MDDQTRAPPAVVLEALAAHDRNGRLGPAALAEEARHVAEEIGVVPAAEAPIAGQHEQVDPSLGTPGEEGMRFGFDTRRHGREQLRELRRVGAGPLSRLMRTAQARRRDHLHRPRDLLGRANRRDPLAEALEARHQAVKRRPNSARAASSFSCSPGTSSFFSRSSFRSAACLASRKA